MSSCRVRQALTDPLQAMHMLTGQSACLLLRRTLTAMMLPLHSLRCSSCRSNKQVGLGVRQLLWSAVPCLRSLPCLLGC